MKENKKKEEEKKKKEKKKEKKEEEEEEKIKKKKKIFNFIKLLISEKKVQSTLCEIRLTLTLFSKDLRIRKVLKEATSFSNRDS